MKYIFGERASGKTMACFELCRKENAYLIVSSLKLKQIYKEMAKKEKYEDLIPRIISFNDYQELKINSHIGNKKFVIDEAGDLLYKIFGENLIGYSETVRDYPKENYKYLRSLMADQTRERYYNGEEIIFKPYYNWE